MDDRNESPWGSSVSLDAEFATSLSDDEIKDFYMQYLTENGWDYHEKDNGYMKDGLRLVVRKKRRKVIYRNS